MHCGTAPGSPSRCLCTAAGKDICGALLCLSSFFLCGCTMRTGAKVSARAFLGLQVLVRGEPNISYICSRYYRAPELIFGATDYTTAIDLWSVGCVMAELLLGQPLFPGESGVDQLVEIIKVR